MKPHTKGILYASTSALLWGFLAIALKVASVRVDSFTIVWMRFSIAFVVLATYFAMKNRAALRIIAHPPPLLILAAIALGWNYLGFMQGIKFTSPGSAQIIIQLGPILLALSGIFVFKEKVSRQQLLGFLIATIGFSFFYRQQLLTLVGSESTFNTGVLWTASGAVAWALYATMQKKLVETHPVQTLNLFIYGLPALLFLPFVDFSALSTLPLSYWALLIFLGANTLIAYGALGAALKYTEASRISIVISMNPIITFIAMALLGHFQVNWLPPEKISVWGYLAAALVLVGAILVVLKQKKKRN